MFKGRTLGYLSEMANHFNQLVEFVKKYERHVGVGALVFGFIWDTLTIGRADQIFGNVVITSYLLLSASIILALSIYGKREREAPVFLVPLLQFCFGNLASGLLVIYGQSGIVGGGIIFLIILLAFVVGNEFVRGYYSKFNFNLSAWYFLLFSYLAVVVPILVGRLGIWIFILSGISSLFVVSLFIYLIQAVSSKSIASHFRETALSIGIIFLFFNFLYFKNIIPPVPLSLTEIGIYHSIERNPDGDYIVSYEVPLWWQKIFRDTSKIFRLGQNENAYCFSSVYAPVELSAGIYHTWEYYDEDEREWQTRSRVFFPIYGGREDGYRGYSLKTNLAEGRWRCSVETARGALVGRTKFEAVSGTPALSEKIF